MPMRMLVSVVCMCALAVSTRAGPPLGDRVPGGTVVYVGWAGTGLTFDGSAAGQLLSSPAVGNLLGAVRTVVMGGLAGEDAEAFAHAWALGAIAWRNPVAVILTDLSKGESGAVPSGAVLIHLGRDREAFAKHLDPIVQWIAKDNKSLIETTIAGVTCKTIKALPYVGDVSFGFLDDLFFVAVGPETPRQLIETSAEKSLVADKKFVECWKRLGGENEQIAFYIDVPVLLERIRPLVCPPPRTPPPRTQSVSPIRRAVEAFGVGKMTAVAGAVRIVDRGMYTKVRLFTPAPHQGLLIPLSGSPLTDEDLTTVPEDADFVGAIRLSPESLWAEIRRVARQYDPEAENDLLRHVARIEEDIGLSISEDILANLGDTIVLSSAPSQGGFLTGTLLIFSAKDPIKLTEAVAKIEEYVKTSIVSPEDRPTRARIETIKVGRVEIHYLTVPGRFPIPIAPAWAVHKDRLYIAGWPQVIASAIEDNGPAKPLTAEPAFRKARARVSPRASILCYVNTPKMIREVYHWALLGWTMGANAIAARTPVNAKPDWLPALSTLEKCLWPQISAICSDEAGITFESYGSLPGMGAFCMPLVSPLGVAVLTPVLNSGRSKAKEAVSGANLKVIGQAILLWSGEEEGRFPPDLGALVQGAYLPPGVLVSPLGAVEPPKLTDGKLVGELDYVYVKPDHGAPGDLIMAYERPENYGGKGTQVLLTDGTVRWMPMDRFQEVLRRTRTAGSKPSTPQQR